MSLDMINAELVSEYQKDFIRAAEQYRLVRIAESANGSEAGIRPGDGMYASFSRWIGRALHITNQEAQLPRRQAHS